MPKVASSDIAHTRTTDHLIRIVTAEEAATPVSRPEETFVGAQAVADRPLVNLLDVKQELPGANLLLGTAYMHGYVTARDVLGRAAPGYLERALALLEPLRGSKDPDALRWLGSAYVLAERSAEAAAVLDEVLESRPEWPEAVAERAYAEYGMRPTEPSTLQAFASAWSADPAVGHVAWTYADLLAARGRPADALDVLYEARRRSGPELHRARVACKIAWDSGLIDRGLIFWVDRIVFLPHDAAELTVAGEAFERTGRVAEARSLAERAVAEDPDDERAVALLRRTRARRGR